MKKILFSTLSFLLIINVLAQNSLEELERLLLDDINRIRQENGVQILDENEILSAAAFDQAEYILELGRVTHEQESAKKKTVQKRVLDYRGLFADLAENATILSKGSKELLQLGGAKVELKSTEQLIAATTTSWLKDVKTSKLNLLDPNFYDAGVSVLSTDDNTYSIVVVFGTKAYNPPSGEKISFNNYNIEPFDELKCKNFLSDFATTPQLFSDVATVEDGNIVLKYHNLAIFKALLASSNDEILVDVIQKNQFDCGEGNQLYPGTIANGYLMKGIKKGKLVAQNKLDSINELELIYNEVPSFYNSKTDELNLILVKDGRHCATVPYNNLTVENKKQFDLKLLLAGESDKQTLVLKDTFEFKYTYTENWQSQWAKDSALLAKSNFKIAEKKVTVSQFPKTINPNEKLEVKWDLISEYVKNSVYQLDLAELKTPQEKVNYLNEAALEDVKLAEFLQDLNTVKIKLIGESTLQTKQSTEELIELYKLFLRTNKIEAALFIQAKLIDKVRKQELEPTKIPLADPAQKASTLKVLNNQIVLESILGKEMYGGNPIYLSFFELYLIKKSEVEVAFNYHVAKLKFWSEDIKNVTDFDTWEKDFSKIPIGEVPVKKYARAKLNYSLLAADYYYDTGKFEKRKDAFDDFLKWYQKADLSNTEMLELVKTLCYHDQYSAAVKILKTYEELEKHEELLYYFLQISIYDRELVSQQLWNEKLKAAKENFPNNFCKFFTKEKIGIQSLSNTAVKEMYCSTCK